MPLEGDVVHFVRQLVEGLAYLHERNIAHLDIKVSPRRESIIPYMAPHLYVVVVPKFLEATSRAMRNRYIELSARTVMKERNGIMGAKVAGKCRKNRARVYRCCARRGSSVRIYGEREQRACSRECMYVRKICLFTESRTYIPCRLLPGFSLFFSLSRFE